MAIRETMIEVIDKGHAYALPQIDGGGFQFLQFVKREGVKYPGNVGAVCGVQSQTVMRVLLDRARYVQRQKSCFENVIVVLCLLIAVWVLEHRAARIHGMPYLHGLHFAETAPTCEQCGHTVCHHADTRA